MVRFGSGGLVSQCERPLFRRWLRLILSSAHVISTQAPTWSAFFGQFPEARGKIVETGNGIELPRDSQPRNGADQVIAFAGWMNREKGIFEALDAFLMVRHRVPGARFILAGGGRDLGRFSERVRELGVEGSVETLGWIARDEVKALFRRARALLFLSHYEGLPNAVLEAMAEGAPVVATRVGALPDVIVDGETGFLVDTGDINAAAGAISRLLLDEGLADRIGRAGRELVMRRFDIERVWPQHARALARAAIASERRAAVQAARVVGQETERLDEASLPTASGTSSTR
jgi:glycosyltransferase involved in cell wall biosynthesis